MRQFRPRANFYSPELKSHYVAGLSYTIREGNDKLARLAQEWAKQGWIEILDIPVVSQLAGRGEISRASPAGFWQKVKASLWR